MHLKRENSVHSRISRITVLNKYLASLIIDVIMKWYDKIFKVLTITIYEMRIFAYTFISENSHWLLDSINPITPNSFVHKVVNIF